MRMITAYKNTYDTTKPIVTTPERALQRIKDCNSKALIEMIRLCTDKDNRNKLKTKLPSVSWSGEFSKRANTSIKKHSRLICLDFDNIENPSELKAELSALPYCYACWLFPSATGIKMLVRVGSDN